MSDFFINQDIDDNSKFIKYLESVEGVLDCTDSYLAKHIKRLAADGSYRVDKNCRIDKIAYEIYGSTDLYWLLMLYNDIADPEELTIGMVIRYPSIRQISNLWLKLKIIGS